MAYTIQTIILFAGLNISSYDGNLHNQNPETAKSAISLMMLVIPAILIILSLIVFSTKFKLHGEYMESITAQLNKKNEGVENEKA